MVNTYFLYFRFALLIVLKAFVYLASNILVLNFPFLISNNISFSLDKYSVLIFDVVLQYQLNVFKIHKVV